MVVPLTMARHGIAGESIGIPCFGILGSIGFVLLCGSLEVIFSTDTKQGGETSMGLMRSKLTTLLCISLNREML